MRTSVPWPFRSALGGRRNVAWIAACSRRALPYPAATAMSSSGSAVSSSSRRAKCARRVRATSAGDAPICSAKQPPQPAIRHAEPRRERDNAARLERAVVDQPKRA
jgi:hypothetical protein